MDFEQKVYSYFEKLSSEEVVIGFSGGTDSCCLALIAGKFFKRVKLFFVRTEIILDEAVKLAKRNAFYLSLPFEIIDANVLLCKEIRENGKMRCYYCKKCIYSAIKLKAGDVPVLDGTNYSDTRSYRPGIKALDELGIITPFRDCKIEREEIEDYLKNEAAFLISNIPSCIAVKVERWS